MKSLQYLLMIMVFCGSCNSSFAQLKKDTLRVLFVGNSYTFTSNIPHLVSLISDKTTTKLITSKSTAGGATLKDHWTNKKGLNTKKEIKDGNFDVVIIQEHSMGAIDSKEDFITYSTKFCKLIRSSGATPYLFVTWARKKVPQYQDSITKVYKEAATLNACELVLAGEAWRLANNLRPDIELFKQDGTHPSDLGAFLTACVFVNTLSTMVTKKLPNWYFITDTNGEAVTLLMEDDLDIVFCTKVAAEITKNHTSIND